MADKHSEKYTFAVDIEMQMRQATKQVADFEKQLAQLTKLPGKFEKAERKSLSAFSRDLESSRKGVRDLQKSLQDASKETSTFGDTARKQAKDMGSLFSEVKDAQTELRKTVIKNRIMVGDAEKKFRQASTKEEKKTLQGVLSRTQESAKAEIDSSRKVYSAKRRNLNKGLKTSGAMGTIRTQQDGAKADSAEFKNHKEAAVDAGHSLKDAAVIAASNLKASKQKAAAGPGGMGSVGVAFSEVSKSLSGIGGMMKPILSSFSALGPLVAGLSGGLAGLVTLMIDAEAGAKEINKTMLQASGTGGYFAQNMGKGKAALEDISQTMTDIRNDATSIDNLSWGINKEDHMAMLSQLAQEGVQVDKFKTQFKTLGENAETSAAHAKSFGGVVQMATAYSRNFGVSLSEITSFQAEMMTELGSGLADVEKEFAAMARTAGESGIAQNKFFNIIRGVSSDLSLYNTRLEDSYKVLGLIGKVMSPKNAAKFMQTAMQGLKGMGNIDRLKLNIMGGNKGKEAVTRDLTRKSGGLADKMSHASGRTITKEDILSKKPVQDLLEGIGPELQGEFREAIMAMRRDQSSNKKGAYGTARAMKNLSPGAAGQAIQDALGLGSGKKFSDMIGDLGSEELAKNAGISEEQLEQYANMGEAIDEQRKSLVSSGKVSEKDADAMSWDQVLDSMDKGTAEELKNSAKIIDYNEQTSNFTSSINDKIKTMVDFLMNQLYNVMLGIWDVIIDISTSKLFDPTGEKAEERARAKAEVAVNKTKNKEMIEILTKSSNTEDFRQKAYKSDSFLAQQDTIYSNTRVMDDFDRQSSQLSTKAGKTSDPEERKKLEAELKAVDAQRDAQKAKYGKTVGAIDKQVGKDPRGSALQVVSAAHMGGIEFNEDQLTKLRLSLQGGNTASAAIKELGLTSGDQAKILDKLRLTLTPGELATSIADGQTQAAAAQGTPAAAPGAPSPGSPAAGAPGGAPGSTQGTPSVGPPKPPGQSEGDAKQGAELIKGTEGIHSALTQSGVKLDKSFLTSDYQKSNKDATLEGTREALFEYALYTSKDPKQLIANMQASGTKAGDLGAAYAADESHKSFLKLKGNATGGQVTGITNGLAVISPAAGEGLASIGTGERIVPAGGGSGGSGSIQINVNGIGGNDLARYLQQRVSEIIYEYKRREKFS